MDNNISTEVLSAEFSDSSQTLFGELNPTDIGLTANFSDSSQTLFGKMNMEYFSSDYMAGQGIDITNYVISLLNIPYTKEEVDKLIEDSMPKWQPIE